MFSLQITSQSHSLHLGNSPACLGTVRQEEGRERKREGEGHGSCFLKQCYKKRLKNPYYSQVVKIITVQNSFFFCFFFLNKGSASSAPCFYRVDCLQKRKKKKPNQNTNPASGVFPSVSTLIERSPTVQRPGHAHAVTVAVPPCPQPQTKEENPVTGVREPGAGCPVGVYTPPELCVVMTVWK